MPFAHELRVDLPELDQNSVAAGMAASEAVLVVLGSREWHS